MRLFRRVLMTLALVLAGGFAVMNPGAVQAFYENLYPSDPLKRQALDLCFLQDHKFNRLDSDEREACYRRALLPLGEMPPGPPSGRPQPSLQPQPNLVDLRRAAGMGSVPHNDIRRQQDEENALRSPHH